MYIGVKFVVLSFEQLTQFPNKNNSGLVREFCDKIVDPAQRCWQKIDG